VGAAQAADEGLAPTKEWVKDLIDEIIADEFASPDLELVWLSEEDADLGKNEAALENRVKLGALTLNELRDALGLDPYPNPAADRPMVLTANGYVPIEAGLNTGATPANNGGGRNAPVARMSDFARRSVEVCASGNEIRGPTRRNCVPHQGLQSRPATRAGGESGWRAMDERGRKRGSGRHKWRAKQFQWC